MSTNPYATQPIGPRAFTVPPTPNFDTAAPTKRKSNWMVPVGGLIGLVFGVLNANYPPLEQFASGTIRPESIGFIFGQIGASLILGLIFGWVAWQVFSRPIRAFIIFAILVGIAALGIASGKLRIDKSKPAPHRSVTR